MLPPYREGMRIAVVGDLQRTAPILEFFREENDRERASVVSEITKERPDLLLFAGDNVFGGGCEAQWRSFDSLTIALREAGIVAASAFGNHEYWLTRASADEHLFARFPLNARRHWFSLAMGPLRIVVLDSNKRRLGAKWSEQLAWYARELDVFDRDATVRGVLLVVHHPPYTNSSVTGDEIHVQRAIVPRFESAEKTLAMLNGHVHSYERFLRKGKMYVVSGGGGGPRARLHTGSRRRHFDDCHEGPALRAFNFVLYTVTNDGLTAEVRGLAKGACEWATIDRFALTFVHAAP